MHEQTADPRPATEASRVEQRLIAVFSRHFRRTDRPQQITKLTCPGWDSLTHIRLVLDLEEAFEIAIAEEDAVKLSSFAACVETVTRRLAERGGS